MILTGREFAASFNLLISSETWIVCNPVAPAASLRITGSLEILFRPSPFFRGCGNTVACRFAVRSSNAA